MNPSDPPFLSEWAVGVTTAPRRSPTLDRCLASLAQAGWTSPRLFAEPGTDLGTAATDCPTTRHDAELGAFSNWYLAATELFLRRPRAEAYLICQDDVVFSADLRPWLEQRLWPAARVGVVSLYCPSHVSGSRANGWHAVEEGWQSWGALAYLFSNPALRTLLGDRLFVDHRHHGPAGGERNIDSVVGEWCRRRGLPYFVHVPSLAQHIGDTSTIWPGARNGGRRRAAAFASAVLPSTTSPSEANGASVPAQTDTVRLGAPPHGDPFASLARCPHRKAGTSSSEAVCLHQGVRTRQRAVGPAVCGSCALHSASFDTPPESKPEKEQDNEAPRTHVNGLVPRKPVVLWLLADLARGGIGTYVANLFKSLIGDEFDANAVVFYTCSPATTDFALARWLSRYTRVICTDERQIADEIVRAHPYIDFRPGPRIYNALIDECDVVTTAADNPHVLARTEWRGKPLLVQLHSTCDLTGRIARKLQPHAGHFVVTSQESFDNATTSFGLPPEKITLIELAVDANRIASWREPAVLREEFLGRGEHRLPAGFAQQAHWALFYGRFAPEKRIPRIAGAVKVLAERGRAWLGFFVGDGWKAAEIRSLIRDLIPERHLMIPWSRSIGDVIRASDAYVCASDHEGGPTSSLEALMAGIPILSTDVGILPSMHAARVPGGPRVPVYRSLGTDPSDIEIADALEAAVNDRQPMTRQPEDFFVAAQAAGRFSLPRKAEQWRHALFSLLSANERDERSGGLQIS